MSRTTSNQKLFHMVVAAMLSGVGILIPMFMPRIVLGPMSFTLASHVAIFIAMFISAPVAVAVCIGTTIGFFLTTSPIIALRAATHIIFAVLGALILKKNAQIIEKPVSSALFNVGLAIVHAVCEVVAVAPFFVSGSLFNAEQLSNGFFMSVIILVGAGTAIHSMIDYSISIVLWKPLRHTLGLKKPDVPKPEFS